MHGLVGVNQAGLHVEHGQQPGVPRLAQVGLALLHLAVVVLNQQVPGHGEALRFDLRLAEVEADHALSVAQGGLEFFVLRLAHRVIHLDVEVLPAARKVRQGDVARAVVDFPAPGAGDVARAVILRRFGAIVRPA